MEVTVQRIKENKCKYKALRENIENYSSSGRLYLHRDFPFYYTDGVRYVKSVFGMGNSGLFLDMAMQAFALSRETDFILIRLCRGYGHACWIEYCKRDRTLLKKVRLEDEIPVDPGLSLSFYFIGRTLLLPTEF